MSKNKETVIISNRQVHVVALYDYVPGENDPQLGETTAMEAPHLDTQLSFLKGVIFEVTGDVDWWLYATSSDGNTGYIPSVLTAPLNTDCLSGEYSKILSHHGDVAPCVIDIEVDLSFFPNTPLDRDTEIHHRKESPEEKANIFSTLTFWWLTGLVWLGFRRPLVSKDLWCLRNFLWSKNIGLKFDKHWKRENERVLRKREKQQSEATTAIENGEVFLATDETEKQLQMEVKYSSDGGKDFHPSLIRTLWRVFGPSMIPAFFLKLCSDSLMFVQPQLLGAIVDFIDDGSKRELWEGILYAVGLFIVATVQTVFVQQYFKVVLTTGLCVRTAVVGIIYRKALVLSTVSRNKSTVGEMVNLMSVDAQRLMDILTYLNLLWSAPYQITLAIFFLYRAMGISVLAGVGVMLLLFPINFFIGKRLRKFQIKQMNIKDLRIKLMNEILNGIKVLKLFAWENSFMSKTLNIRKDELRQLQIFSYLNATHTFLMTSAPILVSLATFGTFVSLGNTLTASKAFVALALFQILRFPLTMLASLLTNVIQALVSIKRLQKFLNMEELDPDHVERNETSDMHAERAAIQITSGTFSWEEEDQPTLKSIDLNVKRGGLVAVVGHVGCGKSSLLSAMLGEIKKLNGHVYLEGSIAYVPQQAWIQNTTLRENILFGKTYDPKRYGKVISNCALSHDLGILPGGDMTEIGEKGINLSGGQKQRVSLARAVYNHADVYLLDDPLSAVDSHVGKHIFDHVIGPKGILKKKTRVLVTHQVRFLPQVDQIIVLRNGVITEVGSYSQLQANDGDFAEFLRTYAKEHEGEQEEFETRERSESQLSAHRYTEPLTILDKSSNINRSITSDSTNVSEKDVIADAEKRAKEDNKMIKEEKAETGRVRFSVFFYYFKSCGISLLLAVLFFLVCSETSLAGSRIWLAHWSTSNITDSSEQNNYVGIYGALGVGQGLFLFLVAMALAHVCVNGATVLHEKLLGNIMRLPLAFFETTPLGRIVNRFSKDIDVIDTMIPRNLSSFFQTSVAILGTVFLICYSTPIFMTVMIPLAVLYVLIQRLYVATSRQLQRLESISRSPIYSHFFETLNGVSTIRAFGAQQRFISLNDVNVDENSMMKYPVILLNRWLAVRLEFIGNCIIFFAALFGVLARDSIQSGLVGLSITVSLRITGTLNWLVRQTSELETHIVSVERVKEYTEAKREASWVNTSYRAPDNWPDKGGIEFQQLGIRYREDLDLALKEIDCQICPSEKIGIVGRTGSGKSTLTLALFRILEASKGRIIIDGINISDIGLHGLRSKITIIPQDPVLFSASLRFNLDPFEKHTDEEIWSALEVAHLKSFVSGLENTLNYGLAEGGENLSVGQRQLVCLARALLRKTKILVLDEATAAVDLETDELIQQTIRKEFSDCTVLTIAHRLNTIMDYTRVMVLSEGQIIEFDTPGNLLESKGVFYDMAKDSNLVS